jgi:prephenate dehydrogenase
MKDIGFKNISIIGVGLIGSSFALSLRKHGFEGTITGIGRNKENLIRAKKLSIINSWTSSHESGVEDADLILLASPVNEFKGIIEKIRSNIKRGAIVTDVGSVKAEIISCLEPLMPEEVYFVGSHPIAGKETSGISAASNDLFNNAKCIITPGLNTDKEALSKVRRLWEAVGSETLIMSPEEHDFIFAAVSHLPHVVAYSLVNSIMEMDSNILYFGGKGLKDMTRIALSSPDLWQGICSFNRENLLKSLKYFSTSIAKITDIIEASDWEELQKEFMKGQKARQTLESN